MTDQAVPTPPLRPLDAPSEGVPDVVDTPSALAELTAALAAGTGPLAVDTERAQSFRYSAKAYLVQLRRAGAGTRLLDPVAFEDGAARADLTGLAVPLRDTEWIVHAATQDLPCLAEIGLVPERLFDTELAGRLLNLPRVGLAPMVEAAFGLTLRKEHSAADWSRRPLPEEWLSYAALDVELLIEMRDWLLPQLEAAGKLAWAEQEFAHLAAHATDVPEARPGAWRRTSGIHAVRSPLGLAVVRELWQRRDEIAAGNDRAPGKVLTDRAIVGLAATITPENVRRIGRRDLRAIDGFAWRGASRYESTWLDAVADVGRLTRDQLPKVGQNSDMPPNPRSWETRHPEAFARWQALRPAANAVAERLDVPAENLITPEYLRRLAWEPPHPFNHATVEGFLAGYGVRPWQLEAIVPALVAAL